MSSLSSLSSSSSSTWYSSSSGENDAFFENMIMYAAQIFMAEDENSEALSQRQTRRTKLNRDKESAHDKLVADYFADKLVYMDEMFRRRGQRGFTTLQKCTSAIRQLAYGYAPDALDEYLRMSERTARECLHRFCEWECSGALIACTGRGRTALLPGKSQIFDDIVAGTGPDTSFTVSGVEYRQGYYLADGIYPKYSTIVKTFPHPTDDKRKKFAKYQEGARKDIEQCFRVLQKRHIIEHPARSTTPKRLRHIMYACIILHNMVIEDEGTTICEYDENASNGNSVPVSLVWNNKI
ncbi:uncharacterized protein LOC110943826 [Helianthus annuus]|uniref:uncharacterized protein LOC110943826 n=1 Tax=Helianthus annuus TaxID=4232 RepID=UPI000B8F7F7F|nr:uncharacterized protein LOC110943826 [Helianthus annuus]